jgi:hypothetical protein
MCAVKGRAPMSVAAPVLAAAAAAALATRLFRCLPYVAAHPEPQRRPTPTYALRPHLTTRPRRETKGYQLFTGIGGLELRSVTLEGIDKCSNI